MAPLKVIRFSKIVMVGLAVRVCLVALGVLAPVAKRLLKANDLIDRCYDDGSSRYIKDHQARAEACSR